MILEHRYWVLLDFHRVLLQPFLKAPLAHFAERYVKRYVLECCLCCLSLVSMLLLRLLHSLLPLKFPTRLRRWKLGGELGGPVDAKAYSSFLSLGFKMEHGEGATLTFWSCWIGVFGPSGCGIFLWEIMSDFMSWSRPFVPGVLLLVVE